MKEFKILVLTVLMPLIALSQEGENQKSDYRKIDPRRFVSIYESTIKNERKLLWKLDCDSSTECLESKKKNFISSGSEIRIQFDHKALAEEEEFYGNISLRANIGSEDVEVSPYFLIGEKQKSYGVSSKPIQEIATNFVKLFSTASKLQNSSTSLIYYSEKERDASDVKEATIRILNRLIEFYEELKLNEEDAESWNDYFSNDGVYDLREVEYSLLSYTDLDFPNVLKVIAAGYKEFDEAALTEVKTLKQSIEQSDFVEKEADSNLDNFLEYELENYKRYLALAKRTLQFMSYFKESGLNSMEAFLDISLLSKIEFEQIHKSFSDNVKKLTDQLNSNRLDLKIINRMVSALDSDIYELNSYNTILCTKLDLIRDSGRDNILGYECDLMLDSLNPTELQQLTASFAKDAGEAIYSKLIYGTIVINTLSLTETNRLDIDLVWYTSEEGLDNGKVLPLTSFYIKKMGWEVSVLESMQLINRINGEDIDPDEYPLSPSVFKPTPGAAFLWTYHDDKEPKRFWKWLEPSFGLNLTYLDFNTEKDFEFGIGPMMGLFQNKMHLTWGFNLNEKDKNPYYFGVGFSFSKVLTSIGKDEE